ncbi:MAG: 30S ribosomal protein S9 [Desulfobacterales bacterium]|nr:30S ribosomal protein S9 [Desulfobacterales bacterium]MBF0396394.1 30S ribosomal protein S9 [Desulfobacterales bacterium]
MEKSRSYYATGRRKTAISRTWLKPGNGKITINDKSIEEYFPLESMRNFLSRPLTLTNTATSYDVTIMVLGGGIAGQAGAIRHGITRALLIINSDLRPVLKKAGFITRDSRSKERKKYGQKSARARFQFSKR